MNKNQQTDCQASHLIEEEYINAMLGAGHQEIDSPVIDDGIIDHNAAYKEPSIECRVFNIAGMDIALPASSIREIFRPQVFPDGQSKSLPALHAGTIDHNDETIELIDIKQLIMNGSNAGESTGNHVNKLTDILLLRGSPTGFLCNETFDEQTVANEQVRWRDAGSERIWLAGTVSQMGLILLDIEGVIRLLQDQG